MLIRMTNDKAPASGNATDQWPPLTAEIDALADSPRSDWAWAFLRRNFDYRAAALQNQQLWLETRHAPQKPLIYRSPARNFVAEEWGLCTFRRS